MVRWSWRSLGNGGNHGVKFGFEIVWFTKDCGVVLIEFVDMVDGILPGALEVLAVYFVLDLGQVRILVPRQFRVEVVEHALGGLQEMLSVPDVARHLFR